MNNRKQMKPAITDEEKGLQILAKGQQFSLYMHIKYTNKTRERILKQGAEIRAVSVNYYFKLITLNYFSKSLIFRNIVSATNL